MDIVRILVFVLSAAIVVATLLSAIRTFVLPRAASDLLTRVVFLAVRNVFEIQMRRARTYLERDRSMALFGPISLLALLPVWYTLVLIGYTGMFWAAGAETWYDALRLSGSSLFTLGFTPPAGLLQTGLALSAAMIGLLLVALLIAYLPTIYSAFARREAAVTLLEVRADNPPSAVEMILRYQRIHGLDRLTELWKTWETWFADIEESHTSLPGLVFFRSPRPDHSWVTAASAVLDGASLVLSSVDIPGDAQAALCIRAGYLALRRIADFFHFSYNPNPRPDDPIQVRREEYDAACDRLAAGGVPLKPDRDQAWRDFAGWRVNYDTVLLALAGLAMAPSAPWSGDRAMRFRPWVIMRQRKGGGRERSDQA